MNQFDDSAQANHRRAAVPAQFARQQDQGGPETLASPGLQISADFGDLGDVGNRLLAEFLLNLLEVVPKEIKNLRTCQGSGGTQCKNLHRQLRLSAVLH
jgi:hypothetical protein